MGHAVRHEDRRIGSNQFSVISVQFEPEATERNERRNTN